MERTYRAYYDSNGFEYHSKHKRGSYDNYLDCEREYVRKHGRGTWNCGELKRRMWRADGNAKTWAYLVNVELIRD